MIGINNARVIVTQHIKNLIHTLIPEEHRWKCTLFAKWDHIIGHMKDKVIIDKIENDILYVRVSHPAWANELQLMSYYLKEKINSHFPQPKISAIKFRCGTIRYGQQSIHPKQPSFSNTTPSIQLTPQETLLLAPFTGKELQSAVSAYLSRCKTIQRRQDGK